MAVDLPVAAADDCDLDPRVVCDSASGSVFAPGSTMVACVAVDAAGNRSTCRLEVQVACGGQVPGDCNEDGRGSLSGAICLLGHLFAGARREFPCGDGSRSAPGNRALLDRNGDHRADISDAVATLAWLFQGGPAHVLGGTCRSLGDCRAACDPRE